MLLHDAYLQLFAELPAKTIVTPNRRLAATLHKHYKDHLTTKAYHSWPTPDILPINTLCQKWYLHYQQFSFDKLPLLLNSAQELEFWINIIRQSNATDVLLQITKTAEAVKSAYQLLQEWQINHDQKTFSESQDYQIFQNWITQFEKHCLQKKYLSEAKLITHLVTLIENETLITKNSLIFMGFTELSPALTSLITILKKKNISVEIFNDETLTLANTSRLNFQNEAEEILTVARFAKKIYLQNKNSKIGCVIPNLEIKRERVKQIFGEVFAENQHFSVFHDDMPYNISAGKSLFYYPLIQIIFKLLSPFSYLPLEQFSSLLLSPFIGEAITEKNGRAMLHHFLYLQNHHLISYDHLLTIPSAQDYCPLLLNRMQKCLTVNYQHAKKSPHEWLVIFNEQLKTWGWPGERELNSEEFQTLEVWQQLTETFASFHMIQPDMSMDEALSTLKRLAENTTFQPESPDVPIQVLGLLEAAGLPFDYLWITHLDDQTWPPPASPNPFIPIKIQRQFQMPHATPLRELSYCERLTIQFKKYARHVIFSHARQEKELYLNISPLLIHEKEITPEALGLLTHQSPSEKIYASKHIESLIDDKGPIYHSNASVKGGVAVLKSQALCPFQAFAKWRLGLEEQEETTLGFRSKDKGILIHKALEKIWLTLKNHQTLLDHSEQDLTSLIQKTIFSLMTDQLPLQTVYKSLEIERLYQLIHQWLTVEKSRPPFQVIAEEKNISITLNQLNFNLRIDRIDELPSGQKLLIDYKTGKSNEISHWFGKRLEDPQLPLYALYDKENISGICYAEIHYENLTFKGISANDLTILGIRQLSQIKYTDHDNWQKLLAEWELYLTTLATQYYEGKASIDPKESHKTCLNCQLQSVCRVNEYAAS